MIEDPEICWRLARGLYNLTKIVNGDKKRKCINDGYELMKSALEKWPVTFLNLNYPCLNHTYLS